MFETICSSICIAFSILFFALVVASEIATSYEFQCLYQKVSTFFKAKAFQRKLRKKIKEDPNSDLSMILKIFHQYPMNTYSIPWGEKTPTIYWNIDNHQFCARFNINTLQITEQWWTKLLPYNCGIFGYIIEMDEAINTFPEELQAEIFLHLNYFLSEYNQM